MQKLQSFFCISIVTFLLFSQINCALDMKQIATHGIALGGVAGIGFLKEKYLWDNSSTDMKKIVPLFSVVCALPVLALRHALEGHRFGKVFQYSVSAVAAVGCGMVAQYFLLKDTTAWKDSKRPVLELGALRGFVYGGSALLIKTIVDRAAHKYFPSNT